MPQPITDNRMDVMSLFKRGPIATPPADQTLALSRETAEQLRNETQKAIREAHLQLTRFGTTVAQGLSYQGPRTEDGGTDIASIRVEVAYVQDMLDTLAVIAEESEKENWGTNARPTVTADLTAVEVVAPAEFSVLTSRCSVRLMHTTIAPNILVRLSGRKIRIDIGVGCRFEESLRLRIDSETSVSMSIDASRVDSAIRIHGEGKRSPERAIFGVRAPGVVFAKKFEMAYLYDISTIDFTGVEFQDSFSMAECRSDGHASFVGVQFHRDVHFEHCLFTHPPDLHNATYRRHLSFEGCRFVAAGTTFGSTCDARDIDAYRVLRGHFAKLRNSRLEGVFFAHEQRGDRMLHHEDLIDRVLSWCYDLLSGYGQSTSRVAAWFIGWNLAFAALYSMAFSSSLHAQRPPFSDWLGLSFTLQNVFNPLALFSEKNVVAVDSMLCFVLALAQTLGSLAIVTVFLLTVRTRFRRGGAGSES